MLPRWHLPTGVNAIVCTGDIANRGAVDDPTEYDQAFVFVSDLHARLGAPSILVVPGNHDVQRTTRRQKNSWRLLLEARNPEQAMDEYLVNSDDRELLQARFTNYETFVERLSSLDTDAE